MSRPTIKTKSICNLAETFLVAQSPQSEK